MVVCPFYDDFVYYLLPILIIAVALLRWQRIKQTLVGEMPMSPTIVTDQFIRTLVSVMSWPPALITNDFPFEALVGVMSESSAIETRHLRLTKIFHVNRTLDGFMTGLSAIVTC